MLRAICAWLISWVPIQPRFRWRLGRRTSCHCARLNGGATASVDCLRAPRFDDP